MTLQKLDLPVAQVPSVPDARLKVQSVRSDIPESATPNVVYTFVNGDATNVEKTQAHIISATALTTILSSVKEERAVVNHHSPDTFYYYLFN